MYFFRSFFIITSLVLLLFSHSLVAEVLIKGKLVNEELEPIQQVRVTLENTSVNTDHEGHFQIKVEPADIYQIRSGKTGYYDSIQTFSHFELAAQARLKSEKTDEESPFIVGTITLVERVKERVMFAFTGDTMMGRRYFSPAFGDPILINDDNRLNDSKAIVKHVKPYLEIADIATTNLETQIFEAIPGDSAPKSISFFSKPETLEALKWAGIDYVTLGNNHTYDYQVAGLQLTLKHLHASGLGFSGADINEERALKAYSIAINNVEFGMLGYNGWEGRSTPSQVAGTTKGGPAYGSATNIIQSVISQINGKRVPIVQYHGGYEYSNNPSGLTEQRLKTAIDNGAALAIGHHPHVTQGIELYKGQLIAYSMGNFVFDQYIPSTPYSFILYVWLDKEQFHRAEIVPIYLKGYTPTPATGLERYTTLKRIGVLSAQRNTVIRSSGGHSIIEARQTEAAVKLSTIRLEQDSQVTPIYLLPFHQSLLEVKVPDGVQYRLGINLLNGSDFESFDLFDAPERSWFFDRDNTVINKFGASGSRSIGLNIVDNTPKELGLQPFRRLYKGDRPSSILVKVKTEKAVKVSFYWQGRRFSQGFNEARENNDWQRIESVELAGNTEWQSLKVDFNSVRYNYPRNGFRAYRIKAVFEFADGKAGMVNIDDFALIEWQNAFSEKPTPLHTSIESHQASYIGLSQPTSGEIQLVYQ